MRFFKAAAGAAAVFFCASALALPASLDDPIAELLSAGTAAPAPLPFGLRAVSTVKTQIGVPYRFGAQLPETGFDCSGLVWWVYHQIGVNLPRTAAEQSRSGREIALSDARPGDILIFRMSGGTGYHAGIFTANSHFIHAPRTGKTVLESRLNSYCMPRLLSVRRIEEPSNSGLPPSADEIEAALAAIMPLAEPDPLLNLIAMPGNTELGVPAKRERRSSPGR